MRRPRLDPIPPPRLLRKWVFGGVTRDLRVNGERSTIVLR
jgi:hypothetical protein